MATCEGSNSTDFCVDIPDIPFHPPITFTFPKCEFGKQSVSNSLASNLGLISGNHFIIAKTKMPCFITFVFQL